MYSDFLLLSGMLLAFVTTFDDVIVTMFVGGNTMMLSRKTGKTSLFTQNLPDTVTRLHRGSRFVAGRTEPHLKASQKNRRPFVSRITAKFFTGLVPSPARLRVRASAVALLAGLFLVFSYFEPASAESTLERARREGVIRIGFANEAPWSFAQSDGTIAGADYDLATLVFNKLGIPQLEGVLTKFGSLIPGLKANRYDIVIAGFYIRPARCEQVLFTEPTIGVGDALVVKAGNPKEITSFKSVAADPSIKLGGVVGAATAQNAKAAGIPDDQIIMFPDFVSAVAALKAGRVDGALQTAVTAEETVRASHDPTIERALPFEQALINGRLAINYAGFAIRLEDADLRDAVNTELAKVLDSQEHRKVLDKYGISPNEIPHGVKTADLCKG